MFQKSIKLLAVLSGFFVLACTSAPKPECLRKEAAMDFGSGSTKAVVAEVNVCEKTIRKVLFQSQVPVAFSETLQASPRQEIPLSFIDQERPRVEKLVTELKTYHPQVIHAVATAAFRAAKNGEAVAASLSKALGISIQVISQEEEARLGYWAALSTRPQISSQNVVVWDIGGGSMQMIGQNSEGKLEIYRGDLASVTFKNRVIRELQKKDPTQVQSPNPLRGRATAALRMARKHAEQNVPEFFHHRAPKATWLGIGGVLARSVKEQVGDLAVYRSEQVRRALRERATWTDQKLGGDYPTTDVTNLALVAGYMEALGLPRVEPVSAYLGQGLILSRLQNSAF